MEIKEGSRIRFETYVHRGVGNGAHKALVGANVVEISPKTKLVRIQLDSLQLIWITVREIKEVLAF